MPVKKRLRVLVTLTVLVLSVAGCDDARVKAFSQFAAAGSAYVTAFHMLTKAVEEEEIAKSNAVLLDARERMYNPPAGSAAEEKENQRVLTQGVEENTRLLKAYLGNLRKLDAHAEALNDYFKELASYTGEKNAKSISDATEALADGIKKAAPEIEKMQFGSYAVGAAQKVGTLVVVHVQAKTLDSILKRDLLVLETAFALQQQAVEALASDLADSVHASTVLAEVNKVYLPYVNRGKLPGSWEADREKAIRGTVIVESADGAKEAITKLRASFAALVEDKPEPVNLRSILDSVEKMSGYAKAVNDGSK